MNAPTAHTLREAGKQSRERFWEDRRQQDQLDKIKAAYTACAWDIGSAFKGALPASVQALHSAIYPNGMPPEAKAQAVGTGMQQDSDKAEIARLRAEQERLVRALNDFVAYDDCKEDDDTSLMVLYGVASRSIRAALASIKQEGKA